MVAPAKTPEKCSLQMMDGAEIGSPLKAEQAKSLFAQQSVKGWWPCSIEKDGKRVLAVSTLFVTFIHSVQLNVYGATTNIRCVFEDIDIEVFKWLTLI